MTWLPFIVTGGVLAALGALVFVVVRLAKRDGRRAAEHAQTAAAAAILERQRDAHANAPDPDNPDDILDRL